MARAPGDGTFSRNQPFVWLVVMSSVARAGPAPIAPEELRHVVFDRVVIADAKGDWGTGPITVEQSPSEQDDRLVMSREIDPKHVPAALRAWNGRKITVGADRCASSITNMHLLAVTETEHESGFWDGAFDPLPARGEVLSTWNASNVWLVGEFDGCGRRPWVRAAELEPPAMAAPTLIADKLRDDALVKFHALPAYRSVQARFHGSGEWEASDSGADPVLRFDLPGRTLLTHAADIHQHGLTEHLLAIWELTEGKELVLRHVATTSSLPRRPFGLGLAIDLRGDGRVLFLYHTDESRGAFYEVGDTLVDVAPLRLATP